MYGSLVDLYVTRYKSRWRIAWRVIEEARAKTKRDVSRRGIARRHLASLNMDGLADLSVETLPTTVQIATLPFEAAVQRCLYLLLDQLVVQYSTVPMKRKTSRS